MKHVLQKFSRGSILAYSLILLGIVFVASIGMMAASVTNLKSVSSNDKSLNAFQIADSGSQAVIKMLKGAGGSDLGDITGVTCSGSDAVVESPGSFLGGSYKVTFLNSNGETMKCSGAQGKIADVASVKSIGTYSDTARAVQVAVAAGGCTGHEGQVVVVRRGSGTSFDRNDFDAIQNFVNTPGATLTGAICRYTSSGHHQVAGVPVGASFSLVDNKPNSGNPGWIAFSSSQERPQVTSASVVCMTMDSPSYHVCTIDSSTGAACNEGWAVYGLCPFDY